MLPIKFDVTVADDMIIIECTLQGNINPVRPRFWSVRPGKLPVAIITQRLEDIIDKSLLDEIKFQ